VVDTGVDEGDDPADMISFRGPTGQSVGTGGVNG
jgi:hypothetical protein